MRNELVRAIAAVLLAAPLRAQERIVAIDAALSVPPSDFAATASPGGNPAPSLIVGVPVAAVSIPAPALAPPASALAAAYLLVAAIPPRAPGAVVPALGVSMPTPAAPKDAEVEDAGRALFDQTRPAWSADTARGIDWSRVDLGRTESIHARVGTYGAYSITELRLPDGSKAMKIEPKDPEASRLRSDLTKRLRVEKRLVELGIPHNKALAYFSSDGRETLLVEMQAAEEGGAHPVKSLFAENGARLMGAVKEDYEKLKKAGLMPDDLGEALLLDRTGKLVLGQLFNVREKGSAEYDAACRKAEAFIANASFVDGGGSRARDLADMRREVSVFQDLAAGREPRDSEGFTKLARYNNVDPADAMAPEIVKRFLANRLPHRAEELGVASFLPPELRTKPLFKTLYVGKSEAITAKIAAEYSDAARRFNLPRRVFEPPFEKGSLVDVFAFKEATAVVRAYAAGKSNPQGYWVFMRDQVLRPDGSYKTGEELRRDLALPEKPDRLAVLEIPADTVGYKAIGASAFGQKGGKPQLYLRTYKEQYRVTEDLVLAP